MDICLRLSKNEFISNFIDDDGIPEYCADNKICPMECSTVQFLISTSHTTFGTQRSFERITKIPKWNKSMEETKEYVR